MADLRHTQTTAPHEQKDQPIAHGVDDSEQADEIGFGHGLWSRGRGHQPMAMSQDGLGWHLAIFMPELEARLEHAERGIDRGRREPLSAGHIDEAIHILDRDLRQVAVDDGLAWVRHMTAEPLDDRDDGIQRPLSIMTGLQEAQIAQDLGLAGGL
jgi:hypothetical protein